MDGKKPSCYSWYDKLDPSCRRCAVRESCVQQQTETRPECFAELYDVNHPECKACLDNSQCSEECAKMANPKIRIKRPAAAVAVAEPEEEEVAVVEQTPEPEDVAVPEAEDDASVYDEMSVEDLRTELADRGLDTTGKRSTMVQRLVDDDSKPAPKPAPVTKTVAVPAKPAAKAAPAAKPAMPAKPAPAAPVAKPAAVAPKAAPVPIAKEEQSDGGAVTLVNVSFKEVLESLSNGMGLVIVREGKNEWTMTLVDKAVATGNTKATVSAGPKLRGDAYWKEIMSPEYYSWYYEDAGNGKGWANMDNDEKLALAVQLGIEPEAYAHDDARVAAMRMVEKIHEALGMEKYKPEYRTKAARDALKS